MIVNQTPYPISFEMKAAQALTCRYGEVGRQYKFIADIDLTGLSANVQVIKPDGTFVIEEATVTVTENEQYIVVEIPLQATVVKGVCRYDINLFQDDDLILYTAEGPLWVDDQLITEDMIESVAEVYGLRFPQDFLTVENLVDIVNYVKAQIINDEVIAEDTTWSSQKIEQEISSVTPEIDVSKVVTGNPIELTDVASAPLVKCVTAITGYQSGTGTPSPDNIRPIVAYTEGEIEVRGKNLFPYPYSSSSFSALGVTGTITRESIKLVGTSTGSFNVVLVGKSNQVFATVSNSVKLFNYDGQYTISGGTANTPLRLLQYRNGVKIEDLVISTSETITVIATDTFEVGIKVDANKNLNDSLYPQIESGDEATIFEPYTSTTHTTTYPSAIYRGSEDCVNGEVTEITRKLTFTGDNSESWIVNTSDNKAIFYIIVPSEYRVNQTFICNEFNSRNVIDYPQLNNNDIGISLAYNYINIRHDEITTVEAWRTFLANNNLEVTLTLATPKTSSVTPTNLPIKSLSSYNHIESSTGEMEVEYITSEYQPLVDLIQSSSHVYSTAEQVVGKWIDGKNLYKKTVVQTTGFSTSYTLNHGITGIDEIIDVYGVFTHTSGDYFYKINDNVPVSNYYTCVSDIGKSSVGVYIGGSRLSSIGKLTLTFIYTKE